MPSVEEHCKRSKKRTGKTYEDLHKWIDAPQKELGREHRRVRHDNTYIPEVKRRWRDEGVKEFLKHIVEDYEDTSDKYFRRKSSAKKRAKKAIKQPREEESLFNRFLHIALKSVKKIIKRDEKEIDVNDYEQCIYCKEDFHFTKRKEQELERKGKVGIICPECKRYNYFKE